MTRETITYIPGYFNSINRGPLNSVDHKEERLIAHLMTVVEPITKESNISFYPYVYLLYIDLDHRNYSGLNFAPWQPNPQYWSYSSIPRLITKQ